MVDINLTEPFFNYLIRAVVAELSSVTHTKIGTNEVDVPFVFMGDDEMWCMAKGHDVNDPLSNESWIYQQVPRCMVKLGSISIPGDQLSSPYTRGYVSVDDSESSMMFTGQFRRMPIQTSLNLNFALPSITSSFYLLQSLCTTIPLTRYTSFVYMGQVIDVRIYLPLEQSVTIDSDLDGTSTSTRNKSVSVDVTVESNLPIYFSETLEPVKHIASTNASTKLTR